MQNLFKDILFYIDDNNDNEKNIPESEWKAEKKVQIYF